MTQKQSGNKLKMFVSEIPVIGYAARIVWHTISLPKQLDNIRSSAENSQKIYAHNQENLSNEVRKMSEQINDFASTLAANQNSHNQLANRIADINHQLQLLNRNSDKLNKHVPSASSSTELLADDHTLDQFYIDFENKFRGTESVIEKRLKVYLPYFKNKKLDYKKHPVLDIGCGRGELLKVLEDAGINSIGLDINESMVKRANKLGFNAIQADAVEYLMSQKPNSISVITGFHIAEHIPFNTLVRLFEACYRALVPGGFIIFETPNPESIHVGSFSFYYDPSHLHPIPPDMLSFTLENRGFDKVDILRLHPKRDDYEKAEVRKDEFIAEIVDRFYAPQDYAVIGYKAE